MRKTVKKALICVSSLALLVCSTLAITNVYEAKAESDYYVETTTFALKEGASIRLNEPTGIRFTTTVANSYAEGKEFGTIIVPKHLNDNDTVDIGDAAQGLNIPFVNVFAEENGAKIYTAVVGDMPVENPAALTLQFQVASYAKEGDNYTYTQTVTRSIAQVASMAYRANSADSISLGFINTAISGLSLTMDDVDVNVDKTVILTVNNLPEGMVAVWSSENEEIATVAEDGTVTAKKEGEVTIVAKIGDEEVCATVRVHKTLQPQFFTLTENTNFAELYTSEDMRLGCTITGSSSSVELTLPAQISLTGPLTIKNVTLSAPEAGTTLYANGYKLYVDEDVTSNNRTNDGNYRLTIYGGAYAAEVESTDITLLGGNYWRVFGGGWGAGGTSVTGDTNVIFGGNANKDDATSDSDSSFVNSILCGGAYNACVGGSTNVAIKDNAKIAYVSGVGLEANGYTKVANVHIEGGKVMNLYGGVLQISGATAGVVTTNKTTINITMTCGVVESVFGGAQGYNMTGDINITLLGGTITRRIIMGCYNDASTLNYILGKFDYDNHVTGTLTLNISKNVQLWSGTSNDSYIYLGSRYSSNFSDEIIIVNFIECQKSDFSVTFKLTASSTNENVSLPSVGGVWTPFY